MSTSQTTSFLSDLQTDGPIPHGKLAYFQARLKNRLYDFVLGKFEEQQPGLTRALLARRIRRRPEVITRLLSSPGNWTLDTVSDLLIGIAGEELDLASSAPGKRAPRNYTEPEWIGPPKWVLEQQEAATRQKPRPDDHILSKAPRREGVLEHVPSL